MPKETRFYELLSVSYDVTEVQLKTAYKRAALKHHPDKNPNNPEAVEIFKDVTKAYEVLSDPQKRTVYDQYGEAGLSEAGGPGGGMNAEDLFSQFFGGGGLGGMFGGGMRPSGPKKSRAIHHVHKVTLEDIYNGKTSKLALSKSVLCSECDGRGGKAGAVKTCPGCGGVGMQTMTRQMGPMIQRFQTVCSECNGEGETIRDKDRCKKCRGKKTVLERQVLHVPVDRGVPNGHKVTFEGEGDQIPGVQAGDVQIEIEEKEHARFQRRGNDLVHNAKIHLYTALAGGIIRIQHLDSRARYLTVNLYPGEVITPGKIKMIRGQGMPSYRHHDFGNMYISFDIEFPSALNPLDEVQRLQLKTILGVPTDPKTRQDHSTNGMDVDSAGDLEVDPLTTAMPADAYYEDVDVEEVEHARGNNATMADDDDDGVPPGAERVQCAAQ